MLNVMQHPSGQLYFNFWYSTTVAGQPQGLFSLMIGPFSPGTYQPSASTTLTSVDGYISEASSPDAVGDRQVVHRQIEGSVLCRPFKADIVPGYLYTTYRSRNLGGKDILYTDFCDDGCDIVRGPFGPSNLYHRAKRVGNYVVMGMGTGTPSNFYGKLYFFAFVGNKYRQREVLWYRTLSAWLAPEPYDLAGYPLKTVPWNSFEGYQVDAEWIADQLGVIDSDFLQETFPPEEIPEVDNVWGDLCQECIDQVRYVDTNTLSFVSELRDVASLIPKIVGLKNPKTWANVYLAFRYGISLTIQDIKALDKGVKNAISSAKLVKDFNSFHSRHSYVGVSRGKPYTDTYVYKVSCRPLERPAMGIVRSLDNWGLYPTYTRMWDMIPASFVVDWAVDVSSYLEQVDSDLIRQFYDVVSTCWSRKVVMTSPVTEFIPGIPLIGNISLIWYYRRTAPLLHQPAFRVDVTLGEFHNYADLTALIIAKKP